MDSRRCESSTREALSREALSREALSREALSRELVERASELDLEPPHLFLGWSIASMATDLSSDERQALVHLIWASLAAYVQGSTHLPFHAAGKAHLEHVLAHLGVSDAQAQAVQALVRRLQKCPVLEPVIGSPEGYQPFVWDAGGLYHQRMWAMERRVSCRLLERLDRKPVGPTTDSVLRDVAASPPTSRGRKMRMSSEQKKAIAAAIVQPLTLIAGEPGTGKTSVVVSLLRAIARLGHISLDAIALAAPTGRAADRMRQSVDHALRHLESPAFADADLIKRPPMSQTLHRLLEFSPRSQRFRRNEDNPIDQRFVIVDEGSMIDISLMDALLRALPHDAQLVILGDAHQLPSVDAGAVFRDLCARARTVVVRLTKNYRMNPDDPNGQAILGAARAVHTGRDDMFGDAEPLPANMCTDANKIRFEGFELLASEPRSRMRYWSIYYTRRIRQASYGETIHERTFHFRDGSCAHLGDLESLFRRLSGSQILTLTRSGPSGTHAINELFHKRVIRERNLPSTEFAPGEPVMVQRNDYARGLFNGDQGIVLSVANEEHEPRLACVFRRGASFVAFPIEAIRRSIELSYAITVHKAQGSEFDHITLALPKERIPLLTRELIYTAITRSRSSAVILGRPKVFAAGVRHGIERFSSLGRWLEQ